MIAVSPWVFVVLSLLCAAGLVATSVWFHRLSEPTAIQTKKYRLFFQGSFLGLLVFGFTPLFVWLLTYPL